MNGVFANPACGRGRLPRSYRLLVALLLAVMLSACATVKNERAAAADAARGIAVVPLVDGSTRIDIATDAAFDFSSATLRPAFTAQLAKVVQPYLRHPVTVSAYTDNVGAAAFNLDLSQRRARAAADVLREQGFNTALLTVRGYGEDNPVASNATETGRRLNRRIELLIAAKIP